MEAQWIFLGYRAKQPYKPKHPSWLPIEEVHSAGGGLCDPPDNWWEKWDFNQAWCDNNPEQAASRVPEGDETYSVYAYWLWLEKLVEEGEPPVPASVSEAFPNSTDFLALPGTEPGPEFQVIGYDVVELAGYMGFGYSPFVSNGLSDEHINKWGLYDRLDQVLERWPGVEWALAPDHGPHFLMRVARKAF